MAMRTFKAEYTVGRFIGEGGHGHVYEGYRKSDKKKVVIKQISKNRHAEGEPPIEVEMMKKLENVDGICRLIEWFEQKRDYIIIMEKTENAVDLFNFIGERGDKISEKDSLIIFKNVFKSILALDDKNLVHRDLKPENILVNRDTLETTLIDFDSCTYKRDRPFKVFNGTEIFYPPEWFISRRCSAEPMTVWSMGLVLYSMIKGDIPFSCVDDITDKQLDFSGFSEPIGDLIRCMLIREEKYRYGYEDLRRALTI